MPRSGAPCIPTPAPLEPARRSQTSQAFRSKQTIASWNSPDGPHLRSQFNSKRNRRFSKHNEKRALGSQSCQRLEERLFTSHPARVTRHFFTRSTSALSAARIPCDRKSHAKKP